jgi:gamma-glutamylcyclotransferase (GGCT)/AIG2-like uncharacterized protein YtfP
MSVHPVTGEFYEKMTTIVQPPNLKIRDVARRLSVRSRLTPDFSTLKKFKSIPLFVYGTEMTDGTDNGLLSGARYLGRAHTLSSKFWMKQTTISPIIFDSLHENHKDNRKVRGEIYEVRVEHIHLLDVFHRNTIATKRTCRNVILEDCRPSGARLVPLTDLAIQNCHVYIGKKNYWKDYELQHRMVTSYAKKEGIRDIPFYEWVNWEYDDAEWGWGRAYSHSPHVG